MQVARDGSEATAKCIMTLRERAPQVHDALQRLMENQPRMAELVVFPKLLTRIVEDLPPGVAEHLSLKEERSAADRLATRILFGLNRIRYRGHKSTEWRGEEFAALYNQIETSLRVWQRYSLNWMALTAALRFVDRLMGAIWRQHCDHGKIQQPRK